MEKRRKSHRHHYFIISFIIFFFLFVSILYIIGNRSLTGNVILNTANTGTTSEIFQNTYKNSSDTIMLNISNGYITGNYTSPIFYVAGNINWTTLSIQTDGIGELPNSHSAETYGIDMTDNILLFHMNELFGEIQDTSGNNNDGTGTELTYNAEGKFKTAVEFSENSSISIPPEDFQNLEDLTILTWINPSPVEKECIFSASNSLANSYLALFILPDKTLQIAYINSSEIILNATTTESLDTEYTLITLTTNSSGNKLYFNNKELSLNYESGTADSPLYLSPLNINTLNLGKLEADNNSESYYNGKIDEFAVFNRALIESEISNIYKRSMINLNFSARTCNNANCASALFTDISDASPISLTLANNSYFQYKAEFDTLNTTYTPKIYTISVEYETILPVQEEEVEEDDEEQEADSSSSSSSSSTSSSATPAVIIPATTKKTETKAEKTTTETQTPAEEIPLIQEERKEETIISTITGFASDTVENVKVKLSGLKSLQLQTWIIISSCFIFIILSIMLARRKSRKNPDKIKEIFIRKNVLEEKINDLKKTYRKGVIEESGYRKTLENYNNQMQKLNSKLK